MKISIVRSAIQLLADEVPSHNGLSKDTFWLGQEGEFGSRSFPF